MDSGIAEIAARSSHKSVPAATMQLSFARHESFHPRFGWLKKGYDAVTQDADFFSRDDASLALGVGRNMARAIRYWLHAFGLAEPTRKQGSRSQGLAPTSFGKRIFGEDGSDPYMEKLSTLWLLHLKLACNMQLATAWWFCFSCFNKGEFSAQDLRDELIEFASRSHSSKVATGSIEKDIQCLFRMYTSGTETKGPIEDSIDSPFAELRLISYVRETRRYRFNFGDKRSLPKSVIVLAAIEWIVSNLGTSASTIAIARLLYDQGSPGMVFRLTEASLCDAVETVASRCKGVRLTESAGLLQLSLLQPHDTVRNILLNQAFNAEN